MSPLLQLIRVLPHQRRRDLLLAVPLMAAAAIAEMVTIGAAIPFLALLVDPRSEGVAAALGPWLDFGYGAAAGAALLLMAAAIAANLMRLAILWFVYRMVAGVARDLSMRLQARLIRQPLSFHARRNSGEMLAAAEKIAWVANNLLLPVLQALVAAGMAVAIAAALVLIDPVAAGAATLGFAAAYVVAAALTRRRLLRWSAVQADSQTERMKLLNESLGAVRDMLLDRSQPYFERRYAAAERRYRRAQARTGFLAAVPRHVLEAIGICGMALVVLAVSARPGGFVAALPLLGALALGAQRLLPLMQQVWMGVAQSRSNSRALADVLALVDGELSDSAATAPAFVGGIRFEGVGYAYAPGRPVLREVSIEIARGETVAVCGPTGAGKSSFVDLLMGLIEPSAGTIRVDGRALDEAGRSGWRALIAHVPQSVYLADDSVAANIVLGLGDGEPDEARLRRAAEAAQAHRFIAALADGYDTKVGERGARLSGGERQRIGIARALYRGRPVLVLDEATNALDAATEAAVLDALGALDATLIIVSHRPAALARCDRIFWVENGGIEERDPAAVRPAA